MCCHLSNIAQDKMEECEVIPQKDNILSQLQETYFFFNF